MVDLLVLVHARHFTGFAVSSFSWIVQVSHGRGDHLFPGWEHRYEALAGKFAGKHMPAHAGVHRGAWNLRRGLLVSITSRVS